MDTGIRRYGDFYREATCPFCGLPIQMPSELKTEFGVFIGGTCSCGAVYTCDLTGHNMGEALMDGLVFACDNDWDKAFSIGSDDYSEVVLNYDINNHMVWNIRDIRGERSGKIIFLRINKKN